MVKPDPVLALLMLFPVRRFALFCLASLCGSLISQGGMTSYTDRGKTDFDTVLQVLNTHGTWSKVGDSWAYTPLDHEAPYTDGRWIYTEFGWCWKGNLPHSWVTEHYGYWKRGADKLWSWYPGPYWLPETVEIRATATHIGWRSAAVDRDGNFQEEPADRYAKTDEWTFVSNAQFANPITPDIIAKPDAAKGYLEDSTECRHTFVTYREIDRPGPQPADFLALSKDGKMFAPKTLEDQLAEQAAPVPTATLTPQPKSPGTNPGTDPTPPVSTKKVKYWITMSLPTFWTAPPVDAKPEEIYLYRPDFYQDEDGISRRIDLWFDPKKRTSLKEALGGSGASTDKVPAATNESGTPAIPAVPVAPSKPAKPHDAFQSPFDDSYHPGSTQAAKAPALISTNDMVVPVPAPVTNAAPSGAVGH